MPTTTSPWASPSSPAGRRLLLTEPATLDAVPVLDDATLAALTDDAAPPTASPGFPVRRTSIRWRFAVRRPTRNAAAPAGPTGTPTRRPVDRRAARSVVLGAAAMVALLVLAAPAVPRTEPDGAVVERSSAVAAAPLGLGRAVGQVASTTPSSRPEGRAATRPPVAGGDVAVALVQPTESLRATPGATSSPAALGTRLGAAVVLAAG